VFDRVAISDSSHGEEGSKMKDKLQYLAIVTVIAGLITIPVFMLIFA